MPIENVYVMWAQYNMILSNFVRAQQLHPENHTENTFVLKTRQK